MKVITQTIIKWKETLLSIEIGDTLEMKVSPFGVPASLSSTASRLKTTGIATFDITIAEGKLIIKRIA